MYCQSTDAGVDVKVATSLKIYQCQVFGKGEWTCLPQSAPAHVSPRSLTCLSCFPMRSPHEGWSGSRRAGQIPRRLDRGLHQQSARKGDSRDEPPHRTRIPSRSPTLFPEPISPIMGTTKLRPALQTRPQASYLHARPSEPYPAPLHRLVHISHHRKRKGSA